MGNADSLPFKVGDVVSDSSGIFRLHNGTKISDNSAISVHISLFLFTMHFIVALYLLLYFLYLISIIKLLSFAIICSYFFIIML